MCISVFFFVYLSVSLSVYLYLLLTFCLFSNDKCVSLSLSLSPSLSRLCHLSVYRFTANGLGHEKELRRNSLFCLAWEKEVKMHPFAWSREPQLLSNQNLNSLKRKVGPFCSYKMFCCSSKNYTTKQVKNVVHILSAVEKKLIFVYM